MSIYPCTSTAETPPGVSQLNFTNGQTVANSVIVPVSATGTACVFVFGRAHIIADITGWLAAGEGFAALPPSRIFDTRSGGSGIPAGRIGNATGTAPPLVVDLLGRNGIPTAGVGAIALNLTATTTSGSGYVSVYPCASAATVPPTVSNVNFSTGRTVPNSVILPVDGATAPGRTCFRVFGSADLIVDVVGWFGTGRDLSTISPVRAFDTRTGAGGVSTTRIGEGGHRPNAVADHGGEVIEVEAAVRRDRNRSFVPRRKALGAITLIGLVEDEQFGHAARTNLFEHLTNGVHRTFGIRP